MLIDVSATISGLRKEVRDSMMILKAGGFDQTVSVCGYSRNRMELASVYQLRNVSRAQKQNLLCFSRSTKVKYQNFFLILENLNPRK